MVYFIEELILFVCNQHKKIGNLELHDIFQQLMKSWSTGLDCCHLAAYMHAEKGPDCIGVIGLIHADSSILKLATFLSSMSNIKLN